MEISAYYTLNGNFGSDVSVILNVTLETLQIESNCYIFWGRNCETELIPHRGYN